MPLLVVGSVALDSVETPTARRDDVLGGSAVYFSYAASYFAPVRLVGVVGDDWPQQHTALLAARGIDTSGLQVVPQAKTFRWRGKYMPNMNDRETLEVHLNVFGDFNPILPESFRQSRFLFLANGSPSLQMRVLDQVAGATLTVADTMDLWINIQHDELLQLFKRIDGLVLNDSEARLLTGEENLVVAGRKVQQMGPRFVVLKKGEHGAMFFSQHETYVMPAYPTGQRRRSNRRWRQLRRRHDGLPGRARELRAQDAQGGHGLRHDRRKLQRRGFQPRPNATYRSRRLGPAAYRIPKDVEFLTGPWSFVLDRQRRGD